MKRDEGRWSADHWSTWTRWLLVTKGFALTAGLSPSRVLKDVMTTSSSLHMCKNQNTTLFSQPYPLLLICTVCRLQSTPPPSEQAVSTPYRWELVSSQVLLVPSPQCTTCAGRKEIWSKSSQVRSPAHLPQHVIYSEHFSHTP